MARYAVITGAGSGLGRDVFLALTCRGYQVFGTAESAAQVVELSDATHGIAYLTLCDITRPDEVASFAASVTTLTGGTVDVLVSPGAGTHGATSVVNAFLPALQAARGRIVDVGAAPVEPATTTVSPPSGVEVTTVALPAELPPDGYADIARQIVELVEPPHLVVTTQVAPGVPAP